MSKLINAGIVICAKMSAYVDADKIRLRPSRLLDSPFISNGLKDEVILRANGLSRPINLSWLSLWWWMKKTYNCSFCVEVGSRRIGFIGLYNSISGKSAEISLVIFDKMHRKQGYGTKAFRLLEQYTQRYFHIKEIHATVATENYGSILFWKKLGFREMNTLDDTIKYVYILK
jgi:RimJ/RimL family protein N-acetyltransferase